MDSRSRPGDRLSLAVIGSGISGMSAAWLLSGAHDVTVYEKDARIGGHTNTADVNGPKGPVSVDTGFIVYNPPSYPNLTRLFDTLGVETQESRMSFSVSLGGGAFEYAADVSAALFAQRSNAVSPRFWGMLRDIVRFYRRAPELLKRTDVGGLTLGEYLDMNGYSAAFAEDYLFPMAAAVWSSPAYEIRRHSAAAFIRFCVNHALLDLTGRPVWRTVTGGARNYAEALMRPCRLNIITGAAVRAVVTDEKAGPLVADSKGGKRRFDRVIIAAHADQALGMIDAPSPSEIELLGAFSYARNRAVLHSDSSLMPRRKKVWSSWNITSARRTPGEEPVSLTYWMNRLQNLDPDFPLFVSLNPQHEPEDAMIHAQFEYEHPMMDAAAAAARRDLWRLQGRRGLYFCGAYFGDGFHEDGLQSGLRAAELAGGVRRPWSCPDENGRIFTGPAEKTGAGRPLHEAA